jgi:hypothetical protein
MKTTNMKTIVFTGLIIITLLTGLFFSCENPIGLGERLDISGPLVEITSPVPRKTVGVDFDLKGSVNDYSGVEQLVITAQLNREPIPKQWRFQKDKGLWEVSENSGASWDTLNGGVWDGTNKSAKWVVPVNMNVGSVTADHGEYLFLVQAWDLGGFSDDNSFRTIVLIYDKNPPKVDIAKPVIYTRFATYSGGTFTTDIPDYANDVAELNNLHTKQNNDTTTWQKPEMLGKFLTQGFQLQWQIEDDHDIWSFEFSFYDVNDESAVIDNDPNTPLPDTYFFRYWQNVGPPPAEPRPKDYPKPNGTINIPALHDATKLGIGAVGEGQYIFEKTIDIKTTVKVVARCYDAAEHVNHEKILGYFIYWKDAGKPWIIFSEGMESYDYYHGTEVVNEINSGYSGNREAYLKDKAFMIYPGRSIKSTALQAQGVSHVEFSLYDYKVTGSSGSIDVIRNLSYMESMAVEGSEFEYTDGTKTRIRLKNEIRSNGAYSQIFSWELKPPPNTGFYVIKAQAYAGDIASDEFLALFRVQDIKFPIFKEPTPAASDPLFMHINTSDGTIKIEGRVTDATEVSSLTMVWINPQSQNYKAMSQLQYFRDQDYPGWVQAKTLARGGASARELQNRIDNGPGATQVNGYPYDLDAPNRLWNIQPVWEAVDDDERQVFRYSVTINLDTELNISASKQALVSQIFLLRAENPDGRVTIITYAPQGDTIVPTIDITEARILRGAETITVAPSQYGALRQFEDGDIIEVYGTWREDSTGYLNVNNYLFNNIVFKINGNTITGANNTNTVRTITPSNGTATSGTFVFKATLGNNTGYTIQTSTMKDTLVVGASVNDIGGNKAESSASWIIQSDRLRFLRVTSEDDGAKNSGKSVKIYLEFSKPVRLNQAIRPELILNSASGNTARAVYDAGQIYENTRQYFTYTVAAGQNTVANTTLDVTGLYYNGAVVGTSDWTNPNYAFVWLHQGEFNANETMYITVDNAHANDAVVGYARLPSGSSNNRSLMANKQITIDTKAPEFDSVTATPQGWHRYVSGTGNETDITIRVKFDENVKAGAGATEPYLTLTANNNSSNNRATFDRVSGDTITFTYRVKSGDNTNGNELQITGFGGTITDVPGTPLVSIGGTRNLTGVYLDTTAPGVPTVNIRGGSPLAVISNTISGSSVSGTSGGTGLPDWTASPTPPSGANIVDLINVYRDTLNLQITGTSGVGTGDTQTLEYSINYGKDWITYTGANNGIDWGASNPQGTYQITARQIDRAGNVSLWSKPVVFNWDRDPLITSITSTSANGTYTNNTSSGGIRADSIDIRVNFRKPITFSGNPGIILNSRTGAVTTGQQTTSQLIFTYLVGTTDNAARLDVTGFSGIDAADATAGGVDVSSMINIANVATANRLAQLKDIAVQTGALTVQGTPTLTASSVNADNSIDATLTVNFNRPIQRGTGLLKITQRAANYRLPAVLTAAQYSKFRGVQGFDDYYTRGTNGYDVTGNSSDTSTKYILNYDINTADAANQPTANGTGGTAIQQFAEAFRQAEALTFNANASAVQISGSTLTVPLTGSNALQVPGAIYVITIPGGFVQDSLEYQSPAVNINTSLSGETHQIAAISGVARPFIRVQRAQDTIQIRNGSATVSAITATQPLTTQARLDCRTPGTTIYYTTAEAATNVTAQNWSAAADYSPPNNPMDWNTPAAPTRPGQPGTGGTTTNPVTIGGNPTIANVQGLQWRIRARAYNNPNWSADSDEMAFRSVLTYQVNNLSDTQGQRLAAGDQIWIRGGDAIGSSNVPGFPLTWEDDWDALTREGRRAGIRVMNLTTNATYAGNATNSSTWRWVTWEINVPAYLDMIMGHDAPANNDTNVKIITQYGPREFAYQRAGWTSYKDQYRLLPGKHRWLYVNANTATAPGNNTGKGAISFAVPFMTRPTYTTSTYTAP